MNGAGSGKTGRSRPVSPASMSGSPNMARSWSMIATMRPSRIIEFFIHRSTSMKRGSVTSSRTRAWAPHVSRTSSYLQPRSTAAFSPSVRTSSNHEVAAPCQVAKPGPSSGPKCGPTMAFNSRFTAPRCSKPASTTRGDSSPASAAIPKHAASMYSMKKKSALISSPVRSAWSTRGMGTRDSRRTRSIAASSLRIRWCSRDITATSDGGAILRTTCAPSRNRIRYRALKNPYDSSVAKSSPTGTWSGP